MNKQFSLEDARKLANEALTALDGVHGDPQKNGNWIRERRLARIVDILVHHIESTTYSIEVP